jgi:TolA-binding protein
MIKGKPSAPAAMALAVLLTSVTFLAGCAETSGSNQSSENFEIRSMIAADRQQMQAMDARLRRMESQLQDLAHNAPSSTVSSAPGPPASPPPSAIPVAPPETIGAPPPPDGNPMPPGAAAAPPGVPASPVGAPPEASSSPAIPPSEGAPSAAATAAAIETERTTIASAPENPGAAAPSAEPNSEEAGNPPPQEGGNENGGPEASAAPGNLETQPAEGEGANAGDATAEEGGASGEQVAANPPAAPPENTPAAIPPARWPNDLAREIQSAGNEKGPAGKVFRSGLQAMQSRDYAAAVDRFGYLQKKFPHSDLQEPAAYFSASALNEMGKYDQAILQYNDLVMRYPKGKYAGEALLREAQDFIQINDKVDARLTLQKLINDQPGTPQAATAQAMMKTLESD